jgi:hypothetical protein
MDAVRIEDGRQVMLKKVLPEEGPYELSITEGDATHDQGIRERETVQHIIQGKCRTRITSDPDGMV